MSATQRATICELQNRIFWSHHFTRPQDPRHGILRLNQQIKRTDTHQPVDERPNEPANPVRIIMVDLQKFIYYVTDRS